MRSTLICRAVVLVVSGHPTASTGSLLTKADTARRPTMIARFLPYSVYRDYWLARLHLRFLADRLRHRQTVLVYQMGKVGSSTVLSSLNGLDDPPAVLHLHTLDRGRLDDEQKLYRSRFADERKIGGHVLRSLLVRRLLAGWPPRPGRWKIVTLIRDPFRRNVSTFFQTLDLHHAHLGFAGRIRRGEVDDRLVQEMVDYFVAEFPHRRVSTWFDDEIRAHFGVDVLAEGIPDHDGYRVVRGERAEVLLVRLDALNRCAREAFAGFLGRNDFRLASSNLARDKYYAEVYRRFLDRVSFPKDLVDEVYGSRMMRALYSTSEIESMRSDWAASGKAAACSSSL